MSATVVSATLIQEKDRRQLLVYYVGEAFQGVEAKYPRIEKIAFTLVVASCKLCPYFQANPIKKAMNKPKATGRMIHWAIELNQFDIEYQPRIAIKVQALADFIAEFTIPDEKEDTDEVERWTIQANGSSVQKRGRVWVIIITPERETLKYGVQLAFSATNNEAEYEGVLTGLRVGKVVEVKNLLLQSDSKLVIGQIKGQFEAKE